MATMHSSVSYHRSPNDKLETFATGVRDGWFNNPTTFPDPPKTQIVFNGQIATYVDKYGAYKNGGQAQKGAFLIAKSDLMTTLDLFAVGTDTVAAGSEETILLGGFKPTKANESAATVPEQPEVKLTRGSTGVIKCDCKAVQGATSYGALISTHALSTASNINDSGQLNLAPGDVVPTFDLNKNRKKQFTGLTPGTTYFVYYYASNSAGVSQLSGVMSIMCA